MKDKETRILIALVGVTAILGYFVYFGKTGLPENNQSGSVLFVRQNQGLGEVTWLLAPGSKEPNFLEIGKGEQQERWEGFVTASNSEGYTVRFTYQHGSGPIQKKDVFFPRSRTTELAIFPSLEVIAWYGEDKDLTMRSSESR